MISVESLNDHYKKDEIKNTSTVNKNGGDQEQNIMISIENQKDEEIEIKDKANHGNSESMN